MSNLIDMSAKNNQNPVIAGVEITTDSEGRFNLNSLHGASGGEKRVGPSYWLTLEGTKSLINELSSQTTGIPVVTKEGKNGGTFAHKLLAISYAGWISPSFQLTVNQTFLDYKTNASKPKRLHPDFTDPLESARGWIEQYEGRVLAEKTKAEIGSRREATAMNIASQAAKKANKLERVLDRSNEYATVKRMAAKHRNMHFNWRELKRVSQDLNCPPIDVFDANYGSVKAYHADVWLETYGVDVPRFMPMAGAA